MSFFRVMTPQPKGNATVHSSPYSGYDRQSPSFDPPPFTTDDLSVARYSKQSRILEWSRIVLSGINLIVAVAITACAGVALRAYSASHIQPEWLLPLWPLHVDLRPTHAMLACGIIITILSLVYMVVSFAPLVKLYPPSCNKDDRKLITFFPAQQSPHLESGLHTLRWPLLHPRPLHHHLRCCYHE